MKTLLLAVMMGMSVTGAMAHAPLATTTPANDASVAQVPSELRLGFKGKIRLTRVTLSHAGGARVTLELGDQKSFLQEFLIPLKDLGSGQYLIDWRGLGEDGHAQQGSFRFTAQ